MTVSYLEWVQGLEGYYWSEEEVITRLQRIMDDSFAAVNAMAQKHRIDLRIAAYMVAIDRVAETDRGYVDFTRKTVHEFL